MHDTLVVDHFQPDRPTSVLCARALLSWPFATSSLPLKQSDTLKQLTSNDACISLVDADAADGSRVTVGTPDGADGEETTAIPSDSTAAPTNGGKSRPSVRFLCRRRKTAVPSARWSVVRSCKIVTNCRDSSGATASPCCGPVACQLAPVDVGQLRVAVAVALVGISEADSSGGAWLSVDRLAQLLVCNGCDLARRSRTRCQLT